MRLLDKIKSKEGITSIWVAALGFVMIGMLTIVLDIGRGYVYKMELQQIADAMSLGGAESGKRVIVSNLGGQRSGHMTIEEGKAKAKATELFKANTAHYDNKEIKNYKVKYNFEGDISSNSKELIYSAGVFHVDIEAEIPRFIGTGKTKITATSTTKINPVGNNIIKDNKVKVTDNKIMIYNSTGTKVFEKSI